MIFFVFPLMGVKVRMGIFDHLRDEIVATVSDHQCGMGMGMRVLDANCVGYQKPGCSSYQDQSHPKSWQRKGLENQKGENHSQKWSHSIVGAGFCRAQLHLCLNIVIDAQPVSHETEQHR